MNAEQLFHTIIKIVPLGDSTEGPLAVTGEPYEEWYLGAYTDKGGDAESFLCRKFLMHFLAQLDSKPPGQIVYFRVRPEYDVVEGGISNRERARLYVRYLISDAQNVKFMEIV